MSLFFFFFLTTLFTPSLSFPYALSYYIDCGGLTNSTDPFNTTWLSDRYYTGGSTSVVSEPLHFRFPQEKNLRYFPLSSGKKNCYILPSLPNGRYYIRTFTVYDNYDGKSHSPSFDVSVEGTLVFSYRSPWQESLARDGAYSDLFAFVDDGDADICFYSIATDPPVIGSLELRQIDPTSYDALTTGNNTILVNYGRLSCGSTQWGPGFTDDVDNFGRSWQSDKEFRKTTSFQTMSLSTREKISGADQSPNYFPMKLYQTAVTGTGVLEYDLIVDAKLDYLLWFHFAEIDSSVSRKGERVFDVVVNDKNVSRVDIFAAVGNFAAYSFSNVVHNLSSTSLVVKFVPVVGAPVISGIENYALVPNDISTSSEQVEAMRALKESLKVPDRMGWNGDPCAPTNWDAWEGVTCHPNKDGTALVISQIDLGSQGLKGYISEKISLLTNLVSLNLSTNSLTGTLPPGLGHKALVRLDLSNNQFTGPIPESLATSSLQQVRLNNNLLEGQVQEELYSIGLHGGAIDLSGNKGLCGVPSLPQCSFFWENGHLSTGGKVGIALSALVIISVLLIVIYIYIKRSRNDYHFAPPHDLMSMAAKRNRYQRQKSLMLLEMESQHAKGLPSLYGPQ